MTEAPVAQSGRSSADVVAVPARAIVDLVLRGESAGGDTALCVRLRPAGGCGAAPTGGTLYLRKTSYARFA